jgi:type II secretory pathway pseudopilin PulG
MRNALIHLIYPKRYRLKPAFSLIEMFVSLGLLAVISVSVMQVLRSAIEQTQNTRMRIHQATVLNTFITFFKADAKNATRIAWDQVDHKWIAFENQKTVIRYSIQPQTAFSDRDVFVREALMKTAPLPNIITSSSAMPTSYNPPDVPMTNFMPAEYASHIDFRCVDPCFDFQAGFRVQWNEPQVETVSTNPYDTLVSIVFGEMGHRHPLVLVFKTLTIPIL